MMIKKTFRIIGLVISIFLGIVILFLLIMTAIHRVLLSVEKKRIIPNGQLVEVNGHNMHVYVEGDNDNSPLLVFLSGGGTSAPVYDFKPLYSLLADEYKVAVVEKIGYGYSEIADVPRDIDTILSETRASLSAVGESGPYVLIPHSMSGLEALRWAQLYPDEVMGIIGIDMAIPSVYIDGLVEVPSLQIALMSMFTYMGIHRFLPVSDLSLTAEEHMQAKFLFYRNTINISFINETRSVLDNAKTVQDYDTPEVHFLLFASSELGDEWVLYQKGFALQNNAKIELFDCGHYIHNYEQEQIAELIHVFISDLYKNR